MCRGQYPFRSGFWRRHPLTLVILASTNNSDGKENQPNLFQSANGMNPNPTFNGFHSNASQFGAVNVNPPSIGFSFGQLGSNHGTFQTSSAGFGAAYSQPTDGSFQASTAPFGSPSTVASAFSASAMAGSTQPFGSVNTNESNFHTPKKKFASPAPTMNVTPSGPAQPCTPFSPSYSLDPKALLEQEDKFSLELIK